MTEWQMITSNDEEIRKLGSCFFKEHATIQDIENACRYVDSLDLETILKTKIIEDLVSNCWNILYKDNDYYNGPIVSYLIKYDCNITNKIEKLKEELEYDRERHDIF